MKDPANEIRATIFTLLNNKLVYGTKTYPVYSVVPNDTLYDYVQIKEIMSTNDGTKDSYISEISILFDIVTAFTNRGTWKIADSLANQLQVLLVRAKLSFTNFTLEVMPFLDNNFQFTEKTDTNLILRKELRYTFSVKQL